MIFWHTYECKTSLCKLIGYFDESVPDSLSTSIIMSLVYDYDASGMDDPIVAHVERATNLAVKELRPEVTAIVAAFPLCKCPMSAFSSGFDRLIDHSHPMRHLHITSEAPSRVVPRGKPQAQR